MGGLWMRGHCLFCGARQSSGGGYGQHGFALLAIAQALGGYPDATVARCSGLDRRGIDLALETPRGRAPARVSFSATLTDSAQLRAATVELAQRARAAINAPCVRFCSTSR
jgi:Protein of unknown function (DUF2470)